MKELKDLVRPNVWVLKPYSSARDEFHGKASVFLDANENPWNVPYNRYPDPRQARLKERIAKLKGVKADSIFLGNGSDEAIDLIIRAFCEPGADSIVTIAPSYGMYEVAAGVNAVECKEVPLDADFGLDAEVVLAEADDRTKVIFLCSPNNPTGNSLDRGSIYKILRRFEGIVVIDEAYIDFSAYPSLLRELDGFPNLVVLQTLSKAWGAAAIRLGMAFASPEIIAVLDKIKYPYNVSLLTQEKALEILDGEEVMRNRVESILSERERLRYLLINKPFFFKVYPSDANFLLVDVGDATAVYDALLKEGVVVRNRDNVRMCHGCLRITVGSPEENDRLLDALGRVCPPIRLQRIIRLMEEKEDGKEGQA